MRTISLRLLVGAFAALSLMCVPAVAAGASNPYLSLAASGVPTPGGTQLFDRICGTAVDPSGRLLVADYQRRSIARFSTELSPSSPPSLVVSYQGSIAIPSTETSACPIALDSAANLYAADFHRRVLRFPAPGYGTPALVDAGPTTGLAVERDSGDVFVGHRIGVAVYGAPVVSGAAPSKLIGVGSLGDAYGLAVSGYPGTAGYVYVADAADDTIKVFDPAADLDDPVATIDGAATPPGGFRDLTDSSLAIDAATGTLYVLDNLQPGFEYPAAAVYAFNAGGVYLGQLPKDLVHAEPSGLAVDNSGGETQGIVYATSGNEIVFDPATELSEGAVVHAFCPPAPASATLDAACPSPTPAVKIDVVRGGTGAGTVTAAGARIACGIVCATEADLGATVSLFAAPKPHSAFAGWSVSGVTSACATSPTCKFTLTAAAQVTATFTAIPQRQLTVTNAGAGAVTSSPVGLNCGVVCAAQFDQGSVVTLHPEPGPGAEFAGWSGACSGLGACKVTLSDDRAVTASFRPIARIAPVPPGEALRTLAISVSGEGSGRISSEPAGIDCGTPCSSAYAPGTTVTLSATPDRESRFLGWTGCDTVTAGRCTVTLGISRTVGASFAEGKPVKKPCAKKGAKRGKGSKCKGKGSGKSNKKGKGRR